MDRDVVELDNLHRQLITKKQAKQNTLKAIACAEKLKEANSEVKVEPLVLDVNPSNMLKVIEDMDIILDGTDNFETKFPLNDACLRTDKPCIFGAAVETYGMVFPRELHASEILWTHHLLRAPFPLVRRWASLISTPAILLFPAYKLPAP